MIKEFKGGSVHMKMADNDYMNAVAVRPNYTEDMRYQFFIDYIARELETIGYVYYKQDFWNSRKKNNALVRIDMFIRGDNERIIITEEDIKELYKNKKVILYRE